MSRKYPRSERDRQPCGTTGAYRRHIRNGERPCDDCRKAQKAYRSARAAGMDAELVPITRELRNGLPEFVPYIYRGCDRDEVSPGA